MAASEDLLNRATRGDEEALVRLLKQHSPEIQRGLAGDISRQWRAVLSAEDVMQQTYCDAFLDINKFRGKTESSFVAWLRTMAKHNLKDAIEMLNAEKRRPKKGRRTESEATADSYDDLLGRLCATSTTPSRCAARNERTTAIKDAITKLPDDYRHVVRMCDIQGWSLEEAADALNRTKGAVAMLRVRAHRRLAEIMGSASRFLSGSA